MLSRKVSLLAAHNRNTFVHDLSIIRTNNDPFRHSEICDAARSGLSATHKFNSHFEVVCLSVLKLVKL